jgi:phenylacetate-coenzyme A ligase PaaK-like adenylate-forming protein
MSNSDAILDLYWPPSDSPPHTVRRLMARLLRSESEPEAARLQREMKQLKRIVGHHIQHSKRYRARAAEVGLTFEYLGDVDDISQFPILTREDLSDPEIFAEKVTEADMPLSAETSSGSTGRSLTVRYTRPVRDMLTLLNLRELLWAEIDPKWRFAEVRFYGTPPTDDPAGDEQPHWPGVVNVAASTGPYLYVPIRQPVADIVERLGAFQPEIFRTYPRTLVAMTERMKRTGQRLDSVRVIRTLGEGFSKEERAMVREFWDVPLIDCYGSGETGQLALLCEHDRYHLHSETHIWEVVDAEGEPCTPGVMGRLLVTHLINRATPVLRYEVGDLAIAGADLCPCGRTSPTLTHIEGRITHMIALPSGDHIQFLPHTLDWEEPAALGLAQIVQLAPDRMEFRYQSDEAKPAEMEAAASKRLNEGYGYDFEWTFRAMPQLPSTAGGKAPFFIPLGHPSLL